MGVQLETRQAQRERRRTADPRTFIAVDLRPTVEVDRTVVAATVHPPPAALTAADTAPRCPAAVVAIAPQHPAAAPMADTAHPLAALTAQRLAADPMVVEHLPLTAEAPTEAAAPMEAEVPTVVAEARPTVAAEAADMPLLVEATAAIAKPQLTASPK